MEAKELIDLIISKGISKNKLACMVGTSWSSIDYWHKNVHKPTKKNLNKLKNILTKI